MNFKNRVAVITGAGSGIGRAVAANLAARGVDLALADINSEGLAETASLCMSAKQGVKVSQHRLDVADREAIINLPAEVLKNHAKVDILINNAGVALGGFFEQVSQADFEWLIDINFYGVVRMTRAFLSVLHQSDDACIVNLSSVYGIISPAGQCAYSASKFAVRGFSNALREELKKSKISVCVIHPGGVATSIAKNARVPANAPEEMVQKQKAKMQKFLTLAPEQAAAQIVNGIEKRQARVVIGDDAKLMVLLERVAPVGYMQLFEKLLALRGGKG